MPQKTKTACLWLLRWWAADGAGHRPPAEGELAAAPANEFDKYFAYFKGADPNDPLVYPAFSPKVLQGFPPSLLISGTRDHALSSVLFTHERLSALGVPCELHVIESMGHAFFYDPDLPESHEIYALVNRFFDSHLGHR